MFSGNMTRADGGQGFEVRAERMTYRLVYDEVCEQNISTMQE